MIFYLSRFVVWVFFRSIWRLDVRGHDNIPKIGPVIIAPNHRSYADPPIVGISIKRPIHFLAKKELFFFKPFGWMIANMNAHPLNRTSATEAIKAAQGLLHEGDVITIFPEGGRNQTENFRPPKAGVGLLSMSTGAPVVPAYIRHSQAADLMKLKRVRIDFGAPLYPANYTSYQQMAEAVMASIKAIKEARSSE